MLCPNCSATISATAKFCPNCGTPVTPAQSASPYAAAAAAAEGSPYQAQQASQQAQQAQPNQSPFEKGYKQGYAWATGDNQEAQKSSWADPFQNSGQGSQQQEIPYAEPAYAQPTYAQPAAPVYAQSQPKNHIVAGLLAIFLGSLGIHKFYLGYSKEGIIMLLVTLLTFGIGAFVMEIIALIEGIIYLVKTDEEFYNTYELGSKPWF